MDKTSGQRFSLRGERTELWSLWYLCDGVRSMDAVEFVDFVESLDISLIERKVFSKYSKGLPLPILKCSYHSQSSLY